MIVICVLKEGPILKAELPGRFKRNRLASCNCKEHIFTFILNFKSSKYENNIDFSICVPYCSVLH
jgi:hypothetical protein